MAHVSWHGNAKGSWENLFSQRKMLPSKGNDPLSRTAILVIAENLQYQRQLGTKQHATKQHARSEADF